MARIFIFVVLTTSLQIGCGKKLSESKPSTNKDTPGTTTTPAAARENPSTRITTQPTTAPATVATKTAPSVEKAVVKFTAERLYAASKIDGNFLLSKHGKHVVELVGELTSIEGGGAFGGGSYALLLKAGKGDTDMVNCPIALGRNPFEKCLLGQQVTLRADMSQFSSVGTKPFHWEVIGAAGGYKAEAVTTDGLKAMLEDESKGKGLRGRGLFVTGKIDKIEDVVGRAVLKFGKEKDPVYVQCTMAFPPSSELKTKPEVYGKVGQTVTVYGLCSPYSSLEANNFKLESCVILNPPK